MKIVEAFKTFNPSEADVICSMLQSAGLQASVADSLATLSAEGHAITSQGIRVMVPESEYAEARALIENPAVS